MKFGVISALLPIAVSSTVLAATVVDCSRPPGGQMRCPDTLAAMCNVKSGAVYGECLEPPPSSSPSDLKNFLDKMIKEGKGDSGVGSLSFDEIEGAFFTGEFRNPVDGSTVRFKLP